MRKIRQSELPCIGTYEPYWHSVRAVLGFATLETVSPFIFIILNAAIHVNVPFLHRTVTYLNLAHSSILSDSVDLNLLQNRHSDMSRDMTKPTNWMCAQRKLRSAWASAQSDQSRHCALNEKLRTQACFMRTAKTDQTGRMPRLIWVFARRTLILLVLSWRGSYMYADASRRTIYLFRNNT